MKIDNLKEVLNNYKYLNEIKQIDIFTENIKENALILALNKLPLDTDLQSLSLNNCEYRHYVL